MAKTVVGSFDSFEEARRVVDQLRTMGIDSNDVSLVANDARGQYAPSATGSAWTGTAATNSGSSGSTAGDVATGAVAGGVIGGTAGLIAGLAGLAVPGIGPLVAAGPIAAALAGAGVGAVAGGLVGGLRHIGVSDTDAEYYAEAVRRGGALVTVRVDDARANEVADLMRQHGAIDIEGRVAQWKQSGWSGFDHGARPYSHEDIERERAAYRSAAGVTSSANTGTNTGTQTVSHTTVSGLNRVSNAIERAVPGDSDRDGK